MSVIADRTRTAVPQLPRFVETANEPRITAPRFNEDDGEFANGVFQEKVMGWEAEWIAGRLFLVLTQYCDAKQLGWVNGSNASYQCYAEAFPHDPERFRKPDVSFIAKARMAVVPRGHCKIAPDLAVEVISPNDTFAEIDIKIDEYLKAGVKLVWVVVPETRTVHIHRPDGSTQTLRGRDELSGEDVIPGFKCVIADLFPPVEV